MSHGLIHAEVANAPYAMARGWAIHRLLPELLGQPDWVDLTNLTPRAFQNRIMEIAGHIDCEITQSFLSGNPEAAAWVAGCYRILLKCLVRDWRIHEVLVVEPQLPTILLPNGREIRCGMPDMMGLSDAFNGLVNIEMKTGYKRVKRDTAKLARYNGGAHIFAEDRGITSPVRGTIWITFASTKLNARNGHYTPSLKPEMTYHFERFDSNRIDTFLQRKFGVGGTEMAVLPRHYQNRFA